MPGLGVRPGQEPGRPAQVRVRRRRRPAAPTASRPARGRPRAPSASARPGGTRPRRSGCRSGRTASARGGARWPAGPARGPPRCRPRRPAASSPSSTSAGAVPDDRLAQREVGGDDVVPDQRRHLVARPRARMRGCGVRHGVYRRAHGGGAPAELRLRPTRRTGALRGARPLDTLWRLVVTTVSSCLRYRVTGLAAEAAFFAVLSVPPLVFAPGRRDRLRRQPVRPGPGRPDARRGPRLLGPAAHRAARSTRSSGRP